MVSHEKMFGLREPQLWDDVIQFDLLAARFNLDYRIWATGRPLWVTLTPLFGADVVSFPFELSDSDLNREAASVTKRLIVVVSLTNVAAVL